MKTVYLAEHSSAERRILQSSLEATSEISVATFSDGLSLYESIQEVTPDLVILELDLPKLDGFMLLRLLRFSQPFRHLPLLALTSSRDEILAETVENLGATLLLRKPYDPERLVTTVKSLLHRESLGGQALSGESTHRETGQAQP